eukprot:TRINITY_DN31350_c0_g1_i1.p1 TRINITY_DN31350_c0_g1~~TRINITY_DN31350_c0_g1_i1.p1  ORF type:complete len:836 (-),score=224.48 TRINITY_DN31350_c0_g1_i1:60-2567(-)
MRFLGNLFGGKGQARTTLKDLLKEIAADDVSSATWDKCLGAKNLEDIVDEVFHFEKTSKIAGQASDGCLQVVERCLETIEGQVEAKQEELSEAAEIRLANAILILARLMSVSHSCGEAGRNGMDSKFLAGLWAAGAQNGGAAKPLAERVVDAAVRLCFLDGFTVDPPEKAQAAKDTEVDAARLWHSGLGPQCDEEQPESDEGTRTNRSFCLQLLLSILCGGAPAVILRKLDEDEKTPDEKKTPVMDLNQVGTGVLKDPRALAYLIDPTRSIPYRQELFYSLLASVLDYSPARGWLPGLSNPQADATQTALQTLAFLLHDFSDAKELTSSALKAYFPQKEEQPPGLCDGQRKHFFRDALLAIESKKEVEFMVTGLTSILDGMFSSSVLPGASPKKLPFLAELLQLTFHLSASPKFVAALPLEDGGCGICVGVVDIVFEDEAEGMEPDALVLLSGATLLRLTSHREVALALQEKYDADSPPDIPKFKGSHADLIVLVALKHISDRLSTAASVDKPHPVHQATLDIYFSILANLSVFTEGFCAPACLKLYSLFERCSRGGSLKQGSSGAARYLPRMLEVFKNVVQYQYAFSCDVVYGLVTRQKTFDSLAEQLTALMDDADKMPEAQQHLELWRTVFAGVDMLLSLVDVVAPELEAAIRKKDITRQEDAKECLPKSVLGILPAPHAFELRTVAYCAVTERCCEHGLLVSVADGPLASTWEAGEESDEEDEEKEAPKAGSKKEKDAKDSGKKDGAERRRRSTSRKPKAEPAPAQGARPRGNSRERTKPGNKEAAAPPPPKDPAAALRQQLEAAAAAGIDVAALLAAAQATQAPAKEAVQE